MQKVNICVPYRLLDYIDGCVYVTSDYCNWEYHKLCIVTTVLHWSTNISKLFCPIYFHA